MIRLLTILSFALAAPAFAMEHKDKHASSAVESHNADEHENHHKHQHEHGEDHADHAMEAADEGGETMLFGLTRTPEIEAALAAGGSPAVVDVLGVVCDFCATAMNKTFGKRAEVAAVYVDLDNKTLNLVFAPGETLDDETITKLVKKAGYRISSIRRGEEILG